MGRRREPTEDELRAEQNKEIDVAIEEGKTELDLRTKLQDVAVRACSIKTLTKLTLKCPSFPKEIGQLTALESLSIDGNDWTSMPEEIGNLVNLGTLYAYHNKFPSLPESFGNLVKLRKAVLWQNKLTTLPKSIGKLAKLQELEIKWNPMKSWPAEIGKLEALEEIDAHSMELSDLPADLSGMRKLHRLVLGGNQFETFPKGLLTLPALVELDLSDNGLAELPEDITRIKTLRELKVKENPLKTLPKTLFSLPLTALNVKQCKLTELPPEVAHPPLIGLDVWGNPFKNLPDEIQRQTPIDILSHLGFKKRRVVEGDLPPPDERKAIVAKYKVGFEKFLRGGRDRERTSKIIAFFQGTTNEVPGVAVKDNHVFSTWLTEVFQPYHAWTFVERRMLAFMAQGWRYKYPGFDYSHGWGEQLYRWLKEQIEEEPKGSTLFSDVAREVIAQGVGEDELLAGALRELDESILRKDDKSPTSLGAYLLDVAPRKLELLGTVGKQSAGEAIVGLLLRNRKDLFVKVADKFMVLEPSDSGVLHAPYELLRQACPVEPGRFEKLLFEAIEKTDCDHCRAEAGRVLVENYPQHRSKALELAKLTLTVTSERKNKEERFHFYWSDSENRWEDATAAYIDWCLRTFGKDVHEDVHHLVENTKVFELETAEVVAKALGQAAIDMLGEGLNMHVEDDDTAAHFRRMFALLAPLDWSKYHDKAWELARSEYKQVRQTACLALARLDPKLVLPKAKELLASKRGHEREAGVYVLTLVNHPDAKKILDGLLDTETSDDARDLIAKATYAQEAPCDKAELDRRVKSAKARGKLDKPVVKWLDEKKLPKLFLIKSKTPLDPESVRFLFYRQSRQGEIAIDPEARGPLSLVDRSKAGDFARKLLELVLKNGGVMAKNRFALALIGTLGDERVIEPLEELALEKQNENAARTLGLLGSMEAARALDRILKAYRVKYPNMREAAQEGFDATAERLGLTPFELSDTMIPDFGFQNGRLKIAGTKPELFATLSNERKIAIVDKTNQLVKNPKLAAKPKADVKALGEEVRSAQKQLGANLEYYLIVRRRWNTVAWKTFFEKNPLAASFARGFVWGIYDANGKPKTTFRVTDQGGTVDLAGARVALPNSGEIGLVHPLEIDLGLRDKWLAEIARAAMTPAFPQLDRPTFAVTDEERARGKCYRFEDQELAGATFKGRAERRGWRRGSVIDSGEVSAYRKTFPHDKVEVFVGTNGLSVQSSFDGGDDVTLKDLFFVRPGAVVTGSYTYDEPHDESDARLIRLSDVPPIVFSEAVSDLQAITKRKDEDGLE